MVDLAYEYRLPMALEYVDRDVTTRPLNLQFRNQPVQQILEAIIRQAPKFRVSFSQGLVDITAVRLKIEQNQLVGVL